MIYNNLYVNLSVTSARDRWAIFRLYSKKSKKMRGGMTLRAHRKKQKSKRAARAGTVHEEFHEVELRSALQVSHTKSSRVRLSYLGNSSRVSGGNGPRVV